MQILYSMATQRFSRETLFNIVIMTFMGWFVAFGLLYPSHETIHFHALAEDTLKTLPSGLAGAVGMVKPLAKPSLWMPHSTLGVLYGYTQDLSEVHATLTTCRMASGLALQMSPVM